MTKWKYRIIDSMDVKTDGIFRGRSRESLEAYLNQLGDEGWEIVNLDSHELEGRRSFVGVAKKPA